MSLQSDFKFDAPAQNKETLRQVFNALYFFASAVVVTFVAQAYNLPAIWIVTAVFSVFGFGACIQLCRSETHSGNLDFGLSRRMQTLLRQSALLIPIPFVVLYVASAVAQAQYLEGEALLQRGKYREALTHFNQAVYLNPRMKKAFESLADLHNFTYEFNKTILDTDRALSLDPNDSAAYASKSWALNSMHKREAALAAALTAVKLNPAEGQAQHALAQVCYNLGQYERALPAAEQHIRFHRFEAEAFSLRADILEKLGKYDDASQDRYTADDLRWISNFKPTKVELPQSN